MESRKHHRIDLIFFLPFHYKNLQKGSRKIKIHDCLLRRYDKNTSLIFNSEESVNFQTVKKVISQQARSAKFQAE